jgi:hypothetical protein
MTGSKGATMLVAAEFHAAEVAMRAAALSLQLRGEREMCACVRRMA